MVKQQQIEWALFFFSALVVFSFIVLGVCTNVYNVAASIPEDVITSITQPSTIIVNSQPTNDINNIYKPPIQDHLDRFIKPMRDFRPSIRAPNELSTIGKYMSGGYAMDTGSYGYNPERVATTLLPVHVRPPVDSYYKQVGILTKNSGSDNADILPLMGQCLNNDKWRYYTMLSGNLQTKLPIKLKNKSCTSEYGCSELSNNDLVSVAGFDVDYVTTLYENGTFW